MCPEGTACTEAGYNLHNIEVESGYHRFEGASDLVIWPCPMGDNACPGSKKLGLNGSSTYVRGTNHPAVAIFI